MLRHLRMLAEHRCHPGSTEQARIGLDLDWVVFIYFQQLSACLGPTSPGLL